MSGLDRYFGVLQLFGGIRSEWTVQEIADALNSPTSSVYRSVRELKKVGFLESTVDARYRLGAAFIDFDRRVRLTDPLIRSGETFLATLIDQVRVPCTVVLARLYSDQVMCVANAQSEHIEFKTSFERGRPMPLLRGATSKAILARLPARQLAKLLDAAPEISNSTIDRDPLEKELARVRNTGYCIAFGEVDRGLVGIAAPVRSKSFGIDASISVVLSQPDLTEECKPQILMSLLSTARLIDDFMDRTFEVKCHDQ